MISNDKVNQLEEEKKQKLSEKAKLDEELKVDEEEKEKLEDDELDNEKQIEELNEEEQTQELAMTNMGEQLNELADLENIADEQMASFLERLNDAEDVNKFMDEKIDENELFREVERKNGESIERTLDGFMAMLTSKREEFFSKEGEKSLLTSIFANVKKNLDDVNQQVDEQKTNIGKINEDITKKAEDKGFLDKLISGFTEQIKGLTDQKEMKGQILKFVTDKIGISQDKIKELTDKVLKSDILQNLKTIEKLDVEKLMDFANKGIDTIMQKLGGEQMVMKLLNTKVGEKVALVLAMLITIVDCVRKITKSTMELVKATMELVRLVMQIASLIARIAQAIASAFCTFGASLAVLPLLFAQLAQCIARSIVKGTAIYEHGKIIIESGKKLVETLTGKMNGEEAKKILCEKIGEAGKKLTGYLKDKVSKSEKVKEFAGKIIKKKDELFKAAGEKINTLKEKIANSDILKTVTEKGKALKGEITKVATKVSGAFQKVGEIKGKAENVMKNIDIAKNSALGLKDILTKNQGISLNLFNQAGQIGQNLGNLGNAVNNIKQEAEAITGKTLISKEVLNQTKDRFQQLTTNIEGFKNSLIDTSGFKTSLDEVSNMKDAVVSQIQSASDFKNFYGDMLKGIRDKKTNLFGHFESIQNKKNDVVKRKSKKEDDRNRLGQEIKQIDSNIKSETEKQQPSRIDTQQQVKK